MTRQNAGWVVAGVVAMLTVAVGAATPGTQVGRFQMTSATTLAILPSGPPVEKPDLFLLDTTTGEAWMLLQHKKGDEDWKFVWLEIEDPRPRTR